MLKKLVSAAGAIHEVQSPLQEESKHISSLSSVPSASACLA